jgi:hypothetical protein
MARVHIKGRGGRLAEINDIQWFLFPTLGMKKKLRERGTAGSRSGGIKHFQLLQWLIFCDRRIDD